MLLTLQALPVRRRKPCVTQIYAEMTVYVQRHLNNWFVTVQTLELISSSCHNYCLKERKCTAVEHVWTLFPLFALSQWDINKNDMKINGIPKKYQMSSFWSLPQQLLFLAEDEQRGGVSAFSCYLIKWPCTYLSANLKWLSSKPFCNWMPYAIFTFHWKCYCSNAFCKGGNVSNVVEDSLGENSVAF